MKSKLISDLNIAITLSQYASKGNDLDNLFSQESEINIKIDNIQTQMIKSDITNLIDVSLRNLVISDKRDDDYLVSQFNEKLKKSFDSIKNLRSILFKPDGSLKKLDTSMKLKITNVKIDL